MSKNKKFWTRVTPFSKALALSMFIVFPVLAFLLGIQYKNSMLPAPTSDPTADWKIYTDNKLRFTLKYPPKQVEVVIKQYGSLDVFNITNSKNQMTILDSDNFAYLRSYKNLSDFIKNDCQITKNGFNVCSKSVSGPIPGSLQYDISNSDYPETRTIFQHNGVFYNIHVVDFDQNLFDYKTYKYINPDATIDLAVRQIYNQILSTFKFIN